MSFSLRRALGAFFIVVGLWLVPPSVMAADCAFLLGFKTLRNLIGHDIVGACLEDEHHNHIGDSVQQTTGGLLVWRKSDNWTAFTDVYRTWVNGPDGLQQRLNTERFDWERDCILGVTTIPSTQVPAGLHQSTVNLALGTSSSLSQLARTSPWYLDGVDNSSPSYTESRMLNALGRIDRSSSELARVMTGWAWIFDERTYPREAGVLEYLAGMSEKLPEMVPLLKELAWLADGIDSWESTATSRIYEMATRHDRDLAAELATAPWIVDGIDFRDIVFGADVLNIMADHIQFPHSSPELARQVLSFYSYPPTELEYFAVWYLNRIQFQNPDDFFRLLTESWFDDGLDDEEKVYLIAAGASELDAGNLFEPYGIATRSIALPHSGCVNVWLVHHPPFYAAQESLAYLEDALRAAEQFWGSPLPVDNVVVSFLAPPHYGSGNVGKPWCSARRAGDCAPHLTMKRLATISEPGHRGLPMVDLQSWISISETI